MIETGIVSPRTFFFHLFTVSIRSIVDQQLLLRRVTVRCRVASYICSLTGTYFRGTTTAVAVTKTVAHFYAGFVYYTIIINTLLC